MFEILESIELTLKDDILLRVYVHTGTLKVAIMIPNTTTPGYSLTTTNNSFDNNCSLTIYCLDDTSANGGVPATIANITAGLYINRLPATSYNGINLAKSAAFHPTSILIVAYVSSQTSFLLGDFLGNLHSILFLETLIHYL